MGYKLTNTSDGGKSFMLGKHHSKKTKEKLRKARLGIKVSEETANKTRGGNNGFATPIFQYSKDGVFLREYSCISDAYRSLGKYTEGCRIISTCAKKNSFGKTSFSMGFIWKYEKNS